MLLSVLINNFKSCTNVRIDNIGHVLVLAGRNGVGKTNILGAIEWVAQYASTGLPAELDHFSDRGLTDVALRFMIDERVYVYAVRHQDETALSHESETGIHRFERLTEEKLDGEEVIFVLNKERLIVSEVSLKIGSGISAISSIFSLVPDSPSLPLLAKVMKFLSSIKYYPLIDGEPKSTERPLFVTETELKDWRNGKTSEQKSEMHLKLLTLYLDNRPKFDELCELLGPNSLDVINQISVLPIPVPVSTDRVSGSINTTTTYYLIRFSPGKFTSGRLFSFKSLSFGTRRILKLVTSLLYDDTSVFLLEQPEDGIHDGLLHKLLPLLRTYSDETQIVVTTHSAHILNKVQPEEVRLIDLQSESTMARSLSPAEIVGAQNYMKKEGPLSEFLEAVQE